MLDASGCTADSKRVMFVIFHYDRTFKMDHPHCGFAVSLHANIIAISSKEEE